MVALNRLGRPDRSGKFGNAYEAHARNKIDKSLRNPYERPNLTDGLEAPAVDRRHAGEVRVEGYGNRGPKYVLHATDTGWVALSH